jgi:transcriptional regulator with XRE-family HTH domain
MNEYQKYVEEAYNWAIKNRLAHNKSDFAELVGVDKTTISQIIKGRMSGKATAKKIKLWMDAGPSTDHTLKLTNTFEEGYNKAVRDMDSFNWLAFRREAAKDILVALCTTMPINMEEDVRQAINIADELIRQLKK